MQCLTNFVAFGNCICKLFQLAVKPGKLLLGEAGKFLRYSLMKLLLNLICVWPSLCPRIVLLDALNI